MANEGVRTSRLGPNQSEGMRLLWSALGRFEGSQAKLARAVGVKSSVVNRWLHGDRVPALKLAIRLRDLLGIEPAAWSAEPKRPIVLRVPSTPPPRAA